MKMLDGPKVALGIRILDQIGALAHLLPELEGLKGVTQPTPHVQDVWEHTLSTVQYLEQLLAPLVGQYREDTVADLTVGSAVLWLGRFREQFEKHFRQVLVPERTIRSLLFLAALYHDISKPASREELSGGKIRFLGHPELGAKVVAERGRQLALSVDEINRVERVVSQHMRVHFLSGTFNAGKGNRLERRVIYRFFRDTNEAGVDICLLSLADTRGTYGVTLTQEAWQTELETCRSLFEAYFEKPAEVVSPPRLVSGDDLIRLFGMSPGKAIGRLLAEIREAQAAGEVAGREEALAYARRWLEETKDPQRNLNEQEGEG
jgi:tRNA nucleotidyltransferase/poly(A) polymerase